MQILGHYKTLISIPNDVSESMGQYHWKVDLNEFHIIQYEYKINDYEELVKNRTNMKLKSGKYM